MKLIRLALKEVRECIPDSSFTLGSYWMELGGMLRLKNWRFCAVTFLPVVGGNAVK